ncbi:MAG: protein kinase [Verrucomicrobiota bacterium]
MKIELGIFGLILDKIGGKTIPAPPVVPPTQIIPRQCPQCGAELKPDVSEGLCPACLLQRGIATEGGAPPGTPPFVPPTIPNLARLFPQLEILELIGKGGMGAVYKARQPALDRLVALKILAPRSDGDLDFAERFTREARALAKLSHPNIVAVYDFGQVQRSAGVPPAAPDAGETPALHYFIMEYVDGPNLRQVEQAGKLSPHEALEIIPQICAALQFAHDEGIVHRDIKPENVLLDKKGRVKIADFGLAKILGQEPKDFRLTGVRDVVGTPHYMAPEQLEKPQTVDHRADIYSLGVVFYEMLTGELPLGKFQPPSFRTHGMQIDVRLDEVVLRSLEKEPERRYQQVSEIKTQVETIVATGSAGVPPAESGVAPDSLSRISADEPSGSASWSWLGMERAPFYSTEMRELASHLTKKERNQLRLISGTTGAVYATIMVAVVWGIQTLGFTPTLWNVMGVAGLVLIVCLPIQVRVMRKFYCSTVWGKQRGYKPEQFKIFSFRGSNFWKKISALLFFMAVILCLVKGFNDFFLGAFFKVLPLLPPFQHYIGQAYFPKGDSIEIDTVARFKNWMIVKGHYTLVSHNNATLALYITSTNKNVPEDAKQRMQISNGHGYFELTDSHVVPGLPHISMSADGKSFAALCFGTKAEALEERESSWISETDQTSGDASQLAKEGWQLWQAQKLDEAAAKFQEAVRLAPNYANAWNGLGWATFNSGKIKEAEKAFQKAISLDTNQPGALNGLGQIYLSRRIYDQAETYLLKAAPQAPAAWYGLTRLYLLEGKFDQAESWGQKLVDSGQADDLARQMLKAAQEKHLSEGLRFRIEAPPAANEPGNTPAGSTSTNFVSASAAVESAADYGQTVAGLPPVVVETWPVSGTRDVEPGLAEIRVRFSKEMADGGWSWSTAWENSTPETVGQIHYETDQRTCVLQAKLEPGRTYAYWLNSEKFRNFTDRGGRAAVPYLLIFQTKQIRLERNKE